MAQAVWSRVRKDLQMQPLAEGRIGGDAPLYFERWVYQARKLLVTSQLPIAVIADECGFHSQSHLTKC
jgi:hypothetical protein